MKQISGIVGLIAVLALPANASITAVSTQVAPGTTNASASAEYVRVAGNTYDIIGKNASKSSFVGANMPGMVVDSSNLTKANFTGANLAGATLKGSNFSGAIFFGANLKGAILNGANFSGANFQGACLEGALFDVSNFTDANFAGAILTDSKNNYSVFDGAVMEPVDRSSGC